MSIIEELEREALEHKKRINAKEREENKGERYEFPIEAFPQCLQKLINTLDEVGNYPRDYTAGALILSFATAVGGTKTIKLKSTHADSLCFYLTAVGEASSNKSRPFKSILKPLYDKDYQEYERYKQLLQEAKSEGKEAHERPKQINYILKDFTPEVIARSLEVNKKGLLVFNDELLQWLKSFSRYNSGGTLDTYLSIWSKEPIKVNRANGDSISVKDPLLNIGGTLQPSRLNEAFKDNGSGFIDRFLFCYPYEFSVNEWNLLELNKEIFNKYNEAIETTFLHSNFKDRKPETIELTQEAKEEVLKYVNGNKRSFKNLDVWEKSMIEKLHSYVLRFSLLLYCMDKYTLENDHKDTITINIVERAIKIVEYFKITAYKVRNIIRNGTDYISTLN